MTDGTVGWNPGKLNPKILKPAGPIDPDVAVVYFESSDKDRKPLADLRQLRRPPRQRRRPEVLRRHARHRVPTCSAGQGPGDGDALHRRLLRRHQPHRRPLGRAPGRLRERRADGHHPRRRGAPDLARLKPESARRRSASKSGPVKLAPARDHRPRTSRRPAPSSRAIGDPKAKQPTFLETVQAFKVLDVEARKGKPIEVEVQVVALGDDVAWVSLPGEIFVELGLAIKQDSPFPHTIIAELANGSIGYIPVAAGLRPGQLRGRQRPLRRRARASCWSTRRSAAQGAARGQRGDPGELRVDRPDRVIDSSITLRS